MVRKRERSFPYTAFLDVLTDEGQMTSDIAESVGCSRGTAMNALVQLTKQNAVIRTVGGKDKKRKTYLWKKAMQ